MSTNGGYDGGGLTGAYDSHTTVVATNCYWSGTSNVKMRTGSLVPRVNTKNNNNKQTLNTIKVQNCYYDKQKFPLAICATNSGTGLTTAQMKTQSSYAGWDFTNTWYMGADGYPELKF